MELTKNIFFNTDKLIENLETYVKHTYNWAFNTWSENVWQQFELDGKKVADR